LVKAGERVKSTSSYMGKGGRESEKEERKSALAQGGKGGSTLLVPKTDRKGRKKKQKT